MRRWNHIIADRIGWEQQLKPFLYKKLPPETGWSAVLGSLCALIFIVEAVSGMFLAMYYNPAPDLAYESINYIMNDVTMGRVLRGIHHWGAGAMVILVFLHLAVNYFSSSFKAPRELTWVVGVVLFLITLGLGFTGYLLPWDQKAYWATVVSANILRDIPLVGDLITRIVLGGDTVSGLTLTRFLSIHMLILPSLVILFMAFHIYLVRIHGMAERQESLTSGIKPPHIKSGGIYRFFPDHLYKCAIGFVCVFFVILLLSVLGQVPLEGTVGTIDDSYMPRPEWYYMWLFQLLTFFPGNSEVVGSLAIPIGGVLILFLMPWLSKSNLRGVSDRPLATAVGSACIIGMVYLTIMGFAGAAEYGKIIAVPDRPLTISEKMGLRQFVDSECAYCHNINGKGGRIQGPDIANISAKGRTRDWLVNYIKDPQSQYSWTLMPKYDLSDEALAALSDFILGLDFRSDAIKIVTREEALRGEID